MKLSRLFFAGIAIFAAAPGAVADPIHLVAQFVYHVGMDGKSGFGAGPCTPVRFELQEDGTFLAEGTWEKDFGFGPMFMSYQIRQTVEDGRVQFYFTRMETCGEVGQKSSQKIASPEQLLGKQYNSPLCGLPNHAAAGVGVIFKTPTAETCKLSSG